MCHCDKGMSFEIREAYTPFVLISLLCVVSFRLIDPLFWELKSDFRRMSFYIYYSVSRVRLWHLCARPVLVVILMIFRDIVELRCVLPMRALFFSSRSVRYHSTDLNYQCSESLVVGHSHIVRCDVGI